MIYHDEPAQKDTLKRDQYANVFVKVAKTCETPMVIGLYGGWGVGKTSLMKFIKEINRFDIFVWE